MLRTFPDLTRVEPDFFLEIVLVKRSKSKQINRLARSMPPVAFLPGASTSAVAAKLEMIRTTVIVRRNQRSEICNEIRVVINMDIP